jgi:hypothetical protein
MKSNLNRRAFLRTTAAGGASLLILKNSRSAWSYQANEKLNIALVGVGGRGRWFVDTMPGLGQNVVAMCDVNEARAGDAFARIPQAKKFHDFRRMLDEMERGIDAVIVATPDHTHAVASMAAMKLGKHLLCEKPLTHSIYEARTLRNAANQFKVATQMGNQGTSSEAFRRAVELVQAGVLGEIREVHAWNTGGGAGDRKLPEGTQPVPDSLQWDLWLGPAPDRPFHSEWLRWHAWRDFGTGQLGNWAVHSMNLPFKALKLDELWSGSSEGGPAPSLLRVEAEVSGHHPRTFPRHETIRFQFPARSGMPPVTVHWHNGAGQAPNRDVLEGYIGRKLDWGDAGEKKYRDHAGCILAGSKGVLHATGHNMSFTLHPEEKWKGFEGPEKTMPRSPGHEREWIHACKGGPAAMSHFNYGAALTEFVLLGNIATRLEGAIEFDPRAMKIPNRPEAEAFLQREYRPGWMLG